MVTNIENIQGIDINFDWNIQNLKGGLDNTVSSVEWELIGTSTANNISYSAKTFGLVNFTNDTNPIFIPYSELTKDIIVDWVVSTLPVEDVIFDKNNIANTIKTKINTSIIVPLDFPWDTQSV
jgi:hypothetical protein